MARFFVFGDVHGARDALERLLRAHGVIDELGRRADRSYRVVSVGDLLNLDRGCKSGDGEPGACWIIDGEVQVLARLEQERGSA